MSELKKLDSKALNALLPKETAERFKVVNYQSNSSKVIMHKFGEVDFSTLTVKRAEALLAKGAPFLAAKTPKSKGNDATEDQS